MRHFIALRRTRLLLALLAVGLLLLLILLVRQHPSTAIDGTVLDTADKPLAKVRVFNSGEGLKRIEAMTDAAGCFRFASFGQGRIYLFAQKQGYRFTGVRIQPDAKDVQLTLYRCDEPPPQPALPTALSYEEQLELGRRLLEKLWANADADQKAMILAAAARIDLNLAHRWAATDPARFVPIIAQVALDKIAEIDLEEAFSLLPDDNAKSCDLLSALADRFAASDPPKAMRCAAEMLIRARSMDQPDRTVAIARTGTLIARLGNRDAGRKLVEEAVEVAAKWAASEQIGPYLFGTALAAAPCDASLAMALIEKLPPGRDRTHCQMYIAPFFDDFGRATALIGSGGNPGVQSVAASLAYHIAPKQPAEAIWLMQEAVPLGPGFNVDDDKLLWLGRLATLVAQHDPARAYSVIDQVLACDKFSTCVDPYRDPDAPPTAILAAEALELGYPDRQSVIDWALAARPAMSDPCSMPRESYQHIVETAPLATAAFVALGDPPAAQQMLQDFQKRNQPASAAAFEPPPPARALWLRAWALADPAHAAELAVQALDADKEKVARTGCLQDILLNVVLLWSAPRGERLEYLAPHYACDPLPVNQSGVTKQEFVKVAGRLISASPCKQCRDR